MSKTRLVPLVTGISPHQGVPGTQVTIRGEHLGEDPNDLVALIICGTDCLVSAKWKSSSKIVARLGQAKRGVGDITIVTRSGGRGIANVQFRVFIEEVGPLQESCVWVDESRTVPGRNVVRTIPETTETEDVLGLKVDLSKKLDHSVLSKMFPEASGNLRMENFNPAWYLLENHKFTKLEDLRVGLRNLQICINKEEETSKNIHKANLNSLINCVDALSDLHLKIDGKIKADKKSWPVTSNLAGKISESRTTADKLFREVLSRKDRADATRNALSVLTRFRFIFFLAESIDDNMAKAPKITSFFGQKQHVDDKQRAMDEELVKIMVRQNASMSFFDDEDVQSRTKKAYPDLQVYGRRHFVREVIPQMANDIKRGIVQQIGSGYFSITSDGWQKPSKFPALLSVTTHTVSENFERLDNVLATIPMAKEHTGEEIANLVEQCMQNNGLEMDRLVAMVRDDAKNMQKSCRLLHIDSFQCSAHFYHLVVTDALRSNDEIANLILKVRQWVGGTHCSSLADLLNKYQATEGIAQNRIPMDVPTRWNSTWLMLIGFADNKNALLKVEEQLLETYSSRKPANISQNDWTKLKRLAAALKRLEKEDFVIVKELCKLLKAFYVETCRAEYSTILNDYTRAKSLFRDSEVGLFKEVMAVLDQKINLLKRTIRQKLMDIPTSFEEQSKLIKYLKILDPDSDPAWDCITAYHCWLEDVLWQLQNKYYSLVMEEEKHQQNEGMNLSLMDHNTGGYRHTFITELFALLTEKLQSFWKLSQSYSNSDDEKFQEKQDDIDQMLTNTINVCSWLLLNALVPTSLPESVSKQYKDQFVSWPTITSVAHMNYLFFSLRALRTSIKTLLDFQFNRAHVQPLVELCTTIRLKCLGLVVERASEDILQLGNRENWKMDGGDQTKTSLPDLYETEINEIMMNVKQILSFNNFPGEVDLFSRERVRQMIIDLFVVVILSFKDCYDQLLQLKPSSNPTDQSSKRPNRLFMTGSTVDTMSLSSAGGTETSIPDTKSKAPSLEITSKKLLISICNLEYVINQLLACICRRLTDNGVKFGDLIYKKSKQKLIHYRHSLIKHYIAIKTSAIVAVLDSASYEQLPEEEDVSDFIKELIMCVVFIQAELYLISPQLTNQVLSVAVESSLNGVVKLISRVNLSQSESATQVVIDLAALEEAFQQYLSAQMRSALNSIRARLMNKLDRESFQSSIQNFRQCLRMAIESLQSAEVGVADSESGSGTATTDI